ncbi:MAG: hypothetical protein IKH75_15420 [Ruminococcus sp.]|nr:hypothetical protein [Ruminococcus sp.]
MHERLKTGFNLGLTGNILFLFFGLTCLLYYHTYEDGSGFSNVLEVIAYIIEVCGFIALAISAFCIATSARMRTLMKVCYSIYILLEAVMMFLELNAYEFNSFYHPFSLGLAIVHAAFSGFVCFTFLQLDPDKTALEVVIIVCIGIIFGGMLGNIMGIRIYFSIITNAVSYSLLFFRILSLQDNGDIEIDCYGDKATVTEYRSEFFRD